MIFGILIAVKWGNKMLIYHIKDLTLRNAAKENTKITYADIVKATGISKITLSRMASKRGYNTSSENIEKLCKCFECTPDQFMTIIPDPPEKK